jgi:hypothetical protein
VKFDDTAFEQGLELGSRRTLEHFQLPHNRDRAGALYDVLRAWPGEGNSRFVSLTTEIWVVADVARAVNKERPLTPDELLSYVGTMYSFLNSFKHR